MGFCKRLLQIEKSGYFPRPREALISLRSVALGDHALHMPAYRLLLSPECIPLITTVSIFNVMGEEKRAAAKLLYTKSTPNQNTWGKKKNNPKT